MKLLCAPVNAIACTVSLVKVTYSAANKVQVLNVFVIG